MLLTITNKTKPASDLGFLLHKHPDHLQHFSLSYGNAHVFYPESGDERCTVALLLEMNPIELIKGRRQNKPKTMEAYVNDRPYVCSSFMSTAISRVFGTAMGGKSNQRQELADEALALEASLAVIPCRGGPAVFSKLFEPLGYSVEVMRHPLDPQFPQWTDSPYYTLRLEGTKRLSELLTHLYVLIPVLDTQKHYFVGEDEVKKLLDKGEGWLADHPEKEFIAQRYFKHLRSLSRMALSQLMEEESPEVEAVEIRADQAEAAIEKKINLNQKRLHKVVETLKKNEASSVADVGCGEGKLLKLLLREKSFAHILGLDVSMRCLEIAHERLHMARMPDKLKERITLCQGSLMYRDERLDAYDAITVIEVIEHMELNRLAHFERVIFECARPRLVLITTPNVEYNALFANLNENQWRHSDHRFEWTRQEFRTWAKTVADKYGYEVSFEGIGDAHESFGSPTQMAVFLT